MKVPSIITLQEHAVCGAKAIRGAVLLFSCCLNMYAMETNTADVIVVGATPSGVSAAIAAARSGAQVILVEESTHVGGIVSGGLTNTDINKHASVGGLFNEFKRRIREHYTKTYGENSEQMKLCRDGNMFEPSIAEKVFREMLAGEKGIRVLEGQRVVAANVIDSRGMERQAEPGKRLDGATPKDFGGHSKLVSISAEATSKVKERTQLRAKAFIDATYEGDLAAIAGVPYRVGRESRTTFKEPHAGNIYIRFKDYNPLPGSTGEADGGIQAFCFRLHLTKDKANSVPIEKPTGYNRDDYKVLLDEIAAGKITRLGQVIQFFPMPNGIFEVNSSHPNADTGIPGQSLDLAEENWTWPEAGFEERARIFQRYWTYNEGMLWLLQHDEGVTEALRTEALQWGFPTAEFKDHRHRPHHIYVRQGRRIWGESNFTERSADFEFSTGLPKRQSTGIAIAEYAFDSHAVHKYNPAWPGLREGYLYVPHDPVQIPFGVVVPHCVDGLLVPVACSATHIGYQSIRMEPVFMALGEACGIAATAAQKTQVEVRAVDVRDVQREIINRGGVVLYESQVMRPDGL